MGAFTMFDSWKDSDDNERASTSTASGFLALVKQVVAAAHTSRTINIYGDVFTDTGLVQSTDASTDWFETPQDSAFSFDGAVAFELRSAHKENASSAWYTRSPRKWDGTTTVYNLFSEDGRIRFQYNDSGTLRTIYSDSYTAVEEWACSRAVIDFSAGTVDFYRKTSSKSTLWADMTDDSGWSLVSSETISGSYGDITDVDATLTFANGRGGNTGSSWTSFVGCGAVYDASGTMVAGCDFTSAEHDATTVTGESANGFTFTAQGEAVVNKTQRAYEASIQDGNLDDDQRNIQDPGVPFLVLPEGGIVTMEGGPNWDSQPYYAAHATLLGYEAPGNKKLLHGVLEAGAFGIEYTFTPPAGTNWVFQGFTWMTTNPVSESGYVDVRVCHQGTNYSSNVRYNWGTEIGSNDDLVAGDTSDDLYSVPDGYELKMYLNPDYQGYFVLTGKEAT